MLDFRREKGAPAPTLPSRRRLMYWIVGVGGLAILTARFFEGGLEFVHRMSEPRQPASRIDNRIEEPSSAHPADMLILPMPPPKAAAEATEEPLREGPFPGVMANYLETIQDDTTFRQEESDAWFNMLDVLNRLDEKTLAAQSQGPATFAQLYRQSKQYRGHLVSVAGIVRRVEFFRKAPQNHAGIESYYRLWLFPNDNPGTPMVIYSIGLPKGFPVGDGLEEQVRLDGFFFKRWVYSAVKSLYTTPTLLAKTVEWQPRPSMAAEPPTDVRTLWVVGGALALSIVMAILIYFRTRRRPREFPDERISIGEP